MKPGRFLEVRGLKAGVQYQVKFIKNNLSSYVSTLDSGRSGAADEKKYDRDQHLLSDRMNYRYNTTNYEKR